ncbi:restriction endonuclease subunit S, partial [Xanthomarina sp.]|uniref:restriction endonuclease subunit S n=1 Tax=Xanthomarina sp. TaxID=1931211 RepID=UPI002C088FC8
MRSNYKKLGQFIQEVNIRNSDLNVERLLGVSIRKVLMPSIANTIGTNMKTYKIIKRNQFAYGPVTSRNGDKISIALLEDYDEAIISQAYVVFEIIDETQLLPEYAMMWFRRPEFDRYARFKSHGSARETFDWDELCDTELPIPSIEKQQEIVVEYNTITNRIALNEQLNRKLEETAHALYKHWFVDFEFPNEDGKPYKSSGGEMVYNEELDMDVPEGWEVGSYEQVFDFKTGKLNSNAAVENGSFPFFTCSSETFKT